jgi:hypothetical protein
MLVRWQHLGNQPKKQSCRVLCRSERQARTFGASAGSFERSRETFVRISSIESAHRPS